MYTCIKCLLEKYYWFLHTSTFMTDILTIKVPASIAASTKITLTNSTFKITGLKPTWICKTVDRIWAIRAWATSLWFKTCNSLLNIWAEQISLILTNTFTLFCDLLAIEEPTCIASSAIVSRACGTFNVWTTYKPTWVYQAIDILTGNCNLKNSMIYIPTPKI